MGEMRHKTFYVLKMLDINPLMLNVQLIINFETAFIWQIVFWCYKMRGLSFEVFTGIFGGSHNQKNMGMGIDSFRFEFSQLKLLENYCLGVKTGFG